MNPNLKQDNKINYRDLLYKVLILVGMVTIIVYFLPRDGKFNYQFELNKPWKYGQLMAPFDFPIYKDKHLIEKEQDSLLANFQPYFQIDEKIGKQKIDKFNNDCRSRLKGILPPSYTKHIEAQLKEIYQTGILPSDLPGQVTPPTSDKQSIMVVHSKIASSHDINSLYTVKKAYERLIAHDTAQYKREILSRCALNEYIIPNLIFDSVRTKAAKAEMLDSYSWAKGVVVSGQKIIDRGEIVTPDKYNILHSFRNASIKRSETFGQQRWTLTGQILFVTAFILCFIIYLQQFRQKYYEHKGSLLLLFALIILFNVSTALMMTNKFFTVYILPYAMLPIIIRVFLDSRTAFMAHCINILLCSISLRFPHEFILVQMIAGLVAILSLKELSQRSQIVKTAFLTLLTYFIVYLAFELMTENEISKVNLSMYIYFSISGIFLLFTYPLLFILEKTFGFTSNVTLVELSNINNPLLRRMSETVPGTFQHSMQVSNLAAEAAIRIGADSQLVRTGALYHDIGKMENPAFFTENQSAGINPHKNLSYEQSAQIVISHVTDGLKLAEKNNLPKVIKDFISTHHGAGKTKYFYISWKNEHPNEEPDDSLFTYPGPNPFSKETAILMMADAVEAASRSLPEYTEESISNLVDKIIDSQVNEGFFIQCPITFQDIATIKSVFKEKLKIAYHTRISYPELKK